jgi:hypothetical protein
MKGAVEAKLPPMTGILTHTEYAMYQYVPDLSMRAAAR